MLHPIFTTALRHPELIADHLLNYAELARVESTDVGRSLAGRAVAVAVAAAAGTLALGLAGVAVMLGVMFGRFHWVLVLVPAFAAALALVCVWLARRPTVGVAFEDLRAQLDADVRALHLAGDADARRG